MSSQHIFDLVRDIWAQVGRPRICHVHSMHPLDIPNSGTCKHATTEPPVRSDLSPTVLWESFRKAQGALDVILRPLSARPTPFFEHQNSFTHWVDFLFEHCPYLADPRWTASL